MTKSNRDKLLSDEGESLMGRKDFNVQSNDFPSFHSMISPIVSYTHPSLRDTDKEQSMATHASDFGL